jgi:glucosamine kinase
MRAGGGAQTAGTVAEVALRAVAASGGQVALPADAIVIGAAGAGSATEQRELASEVLRLGIARNAKVLTDGEIALAAAFSDGPGILLTAGTGSIAFARDTAGRMHRAGGFGWQMGDEGSGYWLGRRALELAGRAFDGRSGPSSLLGRILTTVALPAFDDLVRWSVTATPGQVAALAPELLDAARDGEVAALEAVEQAAEDLVSLLATLGRHLSDTDRIPVVATGGLFASGSPLAPAFARALGVALPRAELEHRTVDAPAAALRLAARLCKENE